MRVDIRHDITGNAMKSEDMFNEELGCFDDGQKLQESNKMGCFGKPVNGGKYNSCFRLHETKVSLKWKEASTNLLAGFWKVYSVNRQGHILRFLSLKRVTRTDCEEKIWYERHKNLAVSTQ